MVLVDFWTYSCINCQRTLPHVEAWNAAYAGDGLTVVGVHTPEFAFEHVISNITQAAAQLGVHYPIAVDNNYDTWNNYQNSYWPAEYLVDATGEVRHVDFGEGDYSDTETFIRQLLTAANPKVLLPPRTDVPDRTPQVQTTPESYLGYQHGASNLAGQGVVPDQTTDYPAQTSIPQDEYAYGGQWDVGSEASTAGTGADPRPALPGQRRVPRARGLRHDPGVARRPSEPQRDGLGRAQALPAGRAGPLPGRHRHPGRTTRRPGLRLHLRVTIRPTAAGPTGTAGRRARR